MNIKKYTHLLFLAFTVFSLHIFCIENNTTEEIAIQEEASVIFSYNNEDLITIINHFAELLHLNIILPQADPINVKITRATLGEQFLRQLKSSCCF